MTTGLNPNLKKQLMPRINPIFKALMESQPQIANAQQPLMIGHHILE